MLSVVRRVAVAAVSLSVAGAAVALPSAPAAANPAGTALVISEAYVNGGSAGASYANKFVEFFNPTSSAIVLTGDTLQYRAATSTVVPSGSQVFALSGTVPARGWFLVQLPSNGANGAALPTPDLNTGGSVNPGAGGGTLYIVDGPSGVLPTDASVIDKIGWGNSNSPEGTAPTGNSVTLSYQRTVAGADTDNNAADFATAAPAPQNAGSTPPDPDPEPEPDPVAATVAEIQGTGDASPLAGQTVVTEGVVTAAYPTGGFSGFYLETGGPDTTPGASDAVFVFGSISAAQVAVGDSVRVTGKVTEFAGLTELSSPSVTKLAAPLPAVTPAALPWIHLDTAAEKEAHEGELLAPKGAFTVSDVFDANFYGSFTLAHGLTPLRQPTDAARPGSAEAVAVVADNAARAITLDDGASLNYSSSANSGKPLPWLTPSHSVRVGSRVTLRQPVVLDFRNSLWNLQPRQPVTDDGSAVATFTDTRDTNEQPATLRGTKLATFNVENYFPTTGEEYVARGLGTCTFYTDRQGNRIAVNQCSGSGPRGAATEVSFQRQQAKIVTGINRLDAGIVSLEEVENSAWFGEARDTALATLVDALNAEAGAGTWAYAPSPPAAGLPPLDQQDVIRTAFIYKPAEVALVGPPTVLTSASDPGEPFSIAREPLAQGFKKRRATDSAAFVVVANHWKSKGSGTALYPGDEQDTRPAYDQGSFNATRVREAQETHAFATRTAQSLGTDRIFLVGDFNAYTHEDPMQELYTAGYTDLGSRFKPKEHSYSFDGLAGSLDHVLANPAALALVTNADVWQINAQESVAYNYSRYNYNVTQLFNAADPFAASDHNPEIAGLTLPAR
ncbi:ExeM/NucH family extracellular endonuclease [Actinoplanes sp. NBRC 103695]|uniref:ExeM/NucH family extracellular endonuclease n=1 Tax=Actinoplanes sp. NBRC 103695 TaxID=3032202 RepID=UPI0024A11F02|nr:ExeM/NucH family extracellular endonuclease [Actinoplanes sp. NBRC 103695]GLY98771.1 hypothetical protein Acsp02_60250 [Actinoplanes sp. NBRC 103695]